MNAKMDEIKVSVNDTEETKETAKPSTKKTKPVSKKKKVKPSPQKANNSKPKAKAKVKKGGGFFSKLISVVVTAAIVGGAVYAWQKSNEQKTVEEISEKAQKERMSFEDRLENLKNRLIGIESEKDELMEKSKELEDKAKLLNLAKLDYSNDDYKFGFSYPARFGELLVTEEEAATGTKIIGAWQENDKLVFGGISNEYVMPATSTIPEVIDTQGFVEKRRDYFILGPHEAEYQVNPAQVIELDQGEALLIDKNSFVLDEDADGLPVNIGNNVAIYLNLESDEYSGLAFLNSDFGMLPLDDFVQMVEEMEIK